jgi:hypothetical protein
MELILASFLIFYEKGSNFTGWLPDGYSYQKFLYICRRIGVLAQLARALDWQSRGQGFDSPILHRYNEQ